jgi:hypothetical protein
MVDLEKEIPKEIQDLILKKKKYIKEEIRISNERIILGSQWTEGSFEMSCFNKTCKDLRLILNEKIFKGYHCTKLLEISAVSKNGLRVLEKTEYKKYMLSFFESKIQDHILLKKIKKCFEKFDENGCYSNRENMIWFLIVRSGIYDSGCNDFFKFFGGEAVRKILYEIKDDTYPYLEESGIPAVITFSFKFKEIASFQQDQLVKQLIYSQVFTSEDEEYSGFSLEGYIKREIKPNEILQIISNPNVNELKDLVNKYC